MQQLGYHWTDFYEIRYLGIFGQICRENGRLIKIRQEYRILYRKTYGHV